MAGREPRDQDRNGPAVEDELAEILIEIENEPVPERLLELAKKLQTALGRKKDGSRMH